MGATSIGMSRHADRSALRYCQPAPGLRRRPRAGGGAGGVPPPHRRARRSGHLPASGQCGASGGSAGRARPFRPGEKALVGHSLRHQGQHRCGRRAHHGSLPGVQLRGQRRRFRGGQVARRRCTPDRQDQPGSVRHRAGGRSHPASGAEERARSGHRAGRFEQWFRGGRGAGAGELLARDRYRRLRPRAGRAQRHRRPQADPGCHFRDRCGARLPHARYGVDLRAHGR